MKTQNEVRVYALAASGWIYVWGANGQVITPELMNRLYRDYGSASYPKSYYDNKLAAGAGKKAADCSGFMLPLSGYDDTAHGYYNACTVKGAISSSGSLPKNEVCLVFKSNASGRMYHIGIYLGDGTVAEMASSASNYQHRPLAGGGWTHWGKPKWIDYSADVDPHKCILDLEVALPSLVKGHECSYVKTLQQLLAARGYSTNGVDGIFGAGTESAVKQFQTDAGVKVNYYGTVGSKTWAALLRG